jgi:hypothetical protein
MVEDEAMDIEGHTSSNGDVSSADEKEANETEEKEEDTDDDGDEDMDDISDVKEHSDDDSSHELTYQQQEAIETLSSVFRMLNVEPIHDR